MADEPSGDGGDAADRPQDPLVARLRPEPSEPPQLTKMLSGALGDSDRPGFRRLYFTAELDYYAEFRTEDVLAVGDIAPDQPPFVGEPATRVTLRRDATVYFTRTQRSRPLDEFDLDVRLAPGPLAAAAESTFGCGDTLFFGCTEFVTRDAQCGGPTREFGCQPLPTRGCETLEITICRGRTCVDVCETRLPTFCDQPTCDTCLTRCGEATCQTCNQTCQTCLQATCQTCRTCRTACRGATCQTCHTECNQDTCRTCETRCGGTCNVHVFTCGGQCDRP